MFDHVAVSAADLAESERFYRLVLSALGVAPPHVNEIGPEWDDFAMGQATAARPPTRGLHVGFVAASPAAVDAFWRAGTESGYRDGGPPGPRPQYGDDYYGGFLLDPDGNSAEAVHHGSLRGDGVVDHVWIRVADLESSRGFYDLVAEHGGFQRGVKRPDRYQYRGSQGGSFSIVSGSPTEHLHLAFGVDDDGDIHRFHEAALAAGYRDNGGPGERPQYHPGYYAAFALDPDGNNVELVNHHE
jgi:catechol 2,3-dioxygenase-like lactoylglutathione lyase family enzyme